MDFNEYQNKARETAIYPKKHRLVYPALGLASEAGEVAGKVKKQLRDGGELDKRALLGEIGDCLWYLANLAEDLGYGLGDIAKDNLRKLQSRKKRGKLSGSGDNR